MTTQADWWQIAEMAIAMADATPELDRLRSIGTGLDGYGRGGSERSGPGTTADPALAVVTARAGGKERGDEVAGVKIKAPTPDTWVVPNDAIGVLLAKLAEQSTLMAGTARRIAGLKRLIDGRADCRVGHKSTDCLACDAKVSGEGDDRIRGGYCPACQKAWVRYRTRENQDNRAADHDSFRRYRRAALKKKMKQAS